MKISSVILAAGQGTRMVSNLPKVLHKLNGKALVLYSIESACRVGSEKPVLVVSPNADSIRSVVGDQVRYAVQEKQLGTADAVLSAEALLKNKTDLVLVTHADMPLLTPETLSSLIETQQVESRADDDAHGKVREPARLWAGRPLSRRPGHSNHRGSPGDPGTTRDH